MHMTFDHYLLLVRNEIPAQFLHLQARLHVLELCPTCRRESAAGEVLGSLALGATIADRSPQARLHTPPGHFELLREGLSTMRSAARCSRQDFRRLLRLPMDQWRQRVLNARSRFCSRAFAELLVAEASQRVRSDPQVTAALAELVPLVLERIPGADCFPWNRVLRARAAAHRANALRIRGDLAVAERAFQDLRSELVSQPLVDSVAAAEIDSLEASLHIDRRQFAEAECFLRRAVRSYAAAGRTQGLAKALVQHANLVQARGQFEESLTLYGRAATELSSKEDRYLFLCTVTGRVNALCDLDRAEAAGRLLAKHRGAYLEGSDEHSAAYVDLLQARVDLGLGDFAAAEAGFATARDRLLALDRTYDAIVVSLYLADSLLARDKTMELRDLAASLVPMFRSRGVERETLASLRLLAEAAKVEKITTALVAEVRRRVTSPSPGSGSLPI